MDFKACVKKEDCFIRYIESIQKSGNDYKLILDFDGYAENIKSLDYLSVTDRLHTIISNEYEQTIKEPLKEHMRKV